MASFLARIDSEIERLVSEWNIYTILIILTIIVYLIYPIIFLKEPDIFPLLLSRQSSASNVRQAGESAIYRSLETPHGSPLRCGLNIKDESAPKWSRGRNGDLRDVWKQALRGASNPDGTSPEAKGRIISLKGREGIVEHGLPYLSKEINIIGNYIKEKGGRRVAIYLPNSVEFLVALFATQFYEITPILVPQGQSIESLTELLRTTKADFLVAQAGTLSIHELLRSAPGLNQIMSVVERTSRHMDWNQTPPSSRSNVGIATWHDIIEQGMVTASENLPISSSDPIASLPPIVTIWQDKSLQSFDIIEFSQANIVAAVASQLSVLPRSYRIVPSDVLLPLDPLTLSYPFTLMLASLFSNASIALTSSVGTAADLASIFQDVPLTIVVASSETLSRAHGHLVAKPTGLLQRVRNELASRTLSSGRLPKSTFSTPSPNSLRIIYVSEYVGGDSVPVSTKELFDLRIMLGTRFIYALNAPKVAGAVSQTHLLDYRTDDSKRSHFGAPSSCLEIKLVESEGGKVDQNEPTGRIVASGPAVLEGTTDLGVIGRIRDDNTLAYI